VSAPREAEVKARAFRIAAAVPDPEIPAVTIEDLGILRGIDLDEGILTVRLSPT
jgi:ring-1,2-phenylacetyl-CoA epoxidase subunit PaaD